MPSTITFDATVFATPQTITETDLLHLVSSSPGTGSGSYFYQVVAETLNKKVASARWRPRMTRER